MYKTPLRETVLQTLATAVEFVRVVAAVIDAITQLHDTDAHACIIAPEAWAANGSISSCGSDGTC